MVRIFTKNIFKAMIVWDGTSSENCFQMKKIKRKNGEKLMFYFFNRILFQNVLGAIKVGIF